MRKVTNAVHRFLNARYIRYPNVMHPQFYPARYRVERCATPCALSDAFLRRVAAAFRAAPTIASGDVWSALMPHSAAFCTALETADIAALRHEIARLFDDRGTLTGMAHTARFMKRKGSFSGNHISIRTADALICLAEALAIRGVRSNIQTRLWDYIRETRIDPGALAGAIEAALGHRLLVPQLGAPPLVRVGDRVLSPDGIRHAYLPYRIAQLEIAPSDPILEIGGGFGTMAAYAYLRGYRNYTIIDLPFAGALQALFLASWIGEENVSLYGEPGGAAISLVPSTAKDRLAPHYALTLNVDSLPEIAEAPSYIDLIRARSALFLSVNQESENLAGNFRQWSVARLCDAQGGFQRLSRHLYWMEQGYVEELYRIGGHRRA